MQHEMWLGDLGVLLNFFSSYKQFLTTLSLLAEKKNQNPSFLIVSRELQGSIEWYQINENVLGILIFKWSRSLYLSVDFCMFSQIYYVNNEDE